MRVIIRPRYFQYYLVLKLAENHIHRGWYAYFFREFGYTPNSGYKIIQRAKKKGLIDDEVIYYTLTEKVKNFSRNWRRSIILLSLRR